jgi:hypothetical protein
VTNSSVIHPILKGSGNDNWGVGEVEIGNGGEGIRMNGVARMDE